MNPIFYCAVKRFRSNKKVPWGCCLTSLLIWCAKISSGALNKATGVSTKGNGVSRALDLVNAWLRAGDRKSTPNGAKHTGNQWFPYILMNFRAPPARATGWPILAINFSYSGQCFFPDARTAEDEISAGAWTPNHKSNPRALIYLIYLISLHWT